MPPVLGFNGSLLGVSAKYPGTPGGGGGPVDPPAWTPTLTDFAFFGLTTHPDGGNDTDTYLQDLSGHTMGMGLSNGDVPLVLTPNVFNGKPAYRHTVNGQPATANSDQLTRGELPHLWDDMDDMCIFIPFRVLQPTNTYLLVIAQSDDASNAGRYLYTGLNTGEILTYYQRPAPTDPDRDTRPAFGAYVDVPAGGAGVLIYDFQEAAGARVTFNNTVLANGTQYKKQAFKGGFVLNQQNNRQALLDWPGMIVYKGAIAPTLKANMLQWLLANLGIVP